MQCTIATTPCLPRRHCREDRILLRFLENLITLYLGDILEMNNFAESDRDFMEVLCRTNAEFIQI